LQNFMDLNQLGEFGLIKRLKSHLDFSSHQVVRGIGDDCAVYKPQPGKLQVISCDTLLENVHFDLSFISAEQLGEKALTVNLSDIAAMGGQPKLALIALAIPKSITPRFLDRLYKGFNTKSTQYKLVLAGGDTVASKKHFMINITVLGEVNPKKYFTRNGAQPGDGIFVTGTLGDAALGLKLLKSRKKWKGSRMDRKFLAQKHLAPIPRLNESEVLVRSKIKVSSMIDISDGLLQDLGHICQESKVGARLSESKIPISRQFKKLQSLNNFTSENMIYSGGEDYELLFTAGLKKTDNIKTLFEKIDSQVTFIGEITQDFGKIELINPNGKVTNPRRNLGFNHFR